MIHVTLPGQITHAKSCPNARRSIHAVPVPCDCGTDSLEASLVARARNISSASWLSYADAAAALQAITDTGATLDQAEDLIRVYLPTGSLHWGHLADILRRWKQAHG